MTPREHELANMLAEVLATDIVRYHLRKFDRPYPQSWTEYEMVDCKVFDRARKALNKGDGKDGD